MEPQANDTRRHTSQGVENILKLPTLCMELIVTGVVAIYMYLTPPTFILNANVTESRLPINDI